MIGTWAIEEIDDEIHLKPLTEPTSRFTKHFVVNDAGQEVTIPPFEVQMAKDYGAQVKSKQTQRRAWVNIPPEHKLIAVARRLRR